MGALRTESVERAMSILNAFTSQKPRLTLAELAKETGLHKSTILRLTTSMALFGFINKESDGRYAIGASIWRLGLIFGQDFESGQDIRPVLKDLVRATGETASFYVKAGDERVCLYRENSPNLMRFHMEEGMRLRLQTGASGQVLRFFSGDPSGDPSALNENGSAVSVGAHNPNIASIATPVFSARGELKGALAVSGLITRFDEEARNRAIPLLEAGAARLKQVITS